MNRYGVLLILCTVPFCLYVGVFEEFSFDLVNVNVMGSIPCRALFVPNVISIVTCGLSDLLITYNVSFR